MDESIIVNRFCGLLSDIERKEVFSLLVEYSNKVERLALLFTRAEEYKLALRLSQNNLKEYSRAVSYGWMLSLLLGSFIGLFVALFLSLF